MNTIWKYPLEICDEQVIQVPCFARVLSLGLDPSGKPCLWMLVDTTADKHLMHIRIYGTGRKIDLPVNWAYLGHVVMGPLVWHFLANGEDIQPYLTMAERP